MISIVFERIWSKSPCEKTSRVTLEPAALISMYLRHEGWGVGTVVLWRNFSIPQLLQLEKNLPLSTALTTRWLNFSYTHFTLRSVETYPYFWTSGINLDFAVPKFPAPQNQGTLPAKIKLLIIWVEIIFCQQQKKTTPNKCIRPDFQFKLFIVQSYSR